MNLLASFLVISRTQTDHKSWKTRQFRYPYNEMKRKNVKYIENN